MSNPGYNTVRIALQGNQELNYPVQGEWIACLYGEAYFDLSMIGLDGGGFFFPGCFYRCPEGKQFSAIRVREIVGQSNVVILAYGFGEFRDARGNQHIPYRQAVTVEDVEANPLVPVQIVAENAAREKVIVRADPANAATVRVGDTNTSGSRGVALAPGDRAVEFETTESLYLIGAAGNYVTVTQIVRVQL